MGYGDKPAKELRAGGVRAAIWQDDPTRDSPREAGPFSVK